MTSPATPKPRKRRSDGEQSRAAILDEAARLATVEGIDGLSVARLAEAVGMSKSGLFAHFGSKEELQLATVERAESIFDDRVLEPASTATNGLDRLRRLAYGYLDYVEADIFPGGCFFASTLVEVSMKPGPVRDRLVVFLTGWLELLESCIVDAQGVDLINPGEDPAQLAFDIEAALFLANTQYAVTHTAQPVEHARRAIDQRLATASTPRS